MIQRFGYKRDKTWPKSLFLNALICPNGEKYHLPDLRLRDGVESAVGG